MLALEYLDLRPNDPKVVSHHARAGRLCGVGEFRYHDRRQDAQEDHHDEDLYEREGASYVLSVW